MLQKRRLIKRHVFFLLVFSKGILFSQNNDDITIPYISKVPEGYKVTAIIENNDTIPYIWMPL